MDSSTHSMDTPLTFTVPAGASASCTSTLAVASPASELDAIPSSTGAAVHPMHIPLPESSLDMHGHPALSLSPTRHPLSLDIDAANTCSPNTSRRLPPSSTTPAAHGPATPVSAFSTLSSTHHQHPPHTPSLFSMQYTGRSHLFGAALHPEFLASVDLTEEVLGIGSQAVVLRGTLRPGHPQAGMPVAVKFIFRSRGMARQVRQAFEASGLAELGGHGGGGGSASSTSSSSGGTGGGSDTSSPPPILDMHYELTPQSPRIKETPTEIRVLSTLSHPNLIRYIAHFTDATFYYLILELAGPLVAWSECVADHAWNTEAPQRGFGDAMSAPASPRLGSRSMSSVSLASLAAALSPANALAPMGGMAPPALAHRGSTSLTLPESAATAAAMWSELALLASPAVTSPVHESFASYLSNELELPPLPLWKTSRDLFECLDRFGPFCEDRGRMVFAQLVDVVAYLHANNICHRDLKDENILINDRLEIKLIDFGSATTLDSKQHGSFGTECYNAPEAVKSERKPCTRHTSKSSLSSSSSTAAAAAAAACPLCYDAAKAECWALGVVLYVMLNVSTPYDSAADSLVLPAKPYRRPLSEPVKTVISRLLRREPEKRWGIKDVQESKWLKGVKPLLPMASGASAGGGGVDPAHVKNALGLVAEQHCGGAFSR